MNSEKMNTKMIAIIAGVAAVMLVLIGFLAYRTMDSANQDGTSNTSQQDTNDMVEVFIQADGFSPETLRIKEGTTVRWVNVDSQPHYVVSNPHPEHDGLNGLDSIEPLGPDSSYDYTFFNTGTYGYHDENNVLFNGEVVVE